MCGEEQEPNDQEHQCEDISNTNVTHAEVDLCMWIAISAWYA